MKYKKSTIQIIQKIRKSIELIDNKESLKIALAVSGGCDSMALAFSIIKGKYFFPYEIVIIHINHCWRAEASDSDQTFVEEFARKNNIPCYSYKKPSINKKISPEKEASDQRKEVFKEWVDKGFTIFTAHNANDVLETMLWRLCDAKLETHDKGILIQTDDGQFRPLLNSTKDELQELLINEKQDWKEDKTNHEGRFMRSRLRMNVIPELLKIYPKALKKVSEEVIRKQKK